MKPFTAAQGSQAELFLSLSETRTGSAFSSTAETLLASRVAGVRCALAALVRKWALDPGFEAKDCSGRKRWNRELRRPLDVAGWRMAQAEHDPGAAPVFLARGRAAVEDRRLEACVQGNRYMGASADGETLMALMLLWEVDLGAELPYFCEWLEATSSIGFAKRLKRRVAADAELS